MDTIDKARQYRSNVITFDEVRELHNSLQDEMSKVSGKYQKGSAVGANGAVVFALTGPEGPEFAMVTNHEENGVMFDPSKDIQTMLRYADPIGVVMFAAGVHQPEGKTFKTFKGKSWAKQFASQIISQAANVVPIYRFV